MTALLHQSDVATFADPATLLKDVVIPPRPALFLALQREMQKEEQDIKRIAELINRDVGMASKLLEATNSAFFSLRRKATTVQGAIQMIGIEHCIAVMSGLILHKALDTGFTMMARFWDVSEKRAKGLSFLSQEMQIGRPELAYSFGLFCDIGIPLMGSAFPAYQETLSTNRHGTREFLTRESSRHGTDHASVGAMLARSWAIDDQVVSAIGMHHDYEKLNDQSIPAAIRLLVALNVVVDKAIHELRGEADSLEWTEAGIVASEMLGLTLDEARQLCEGLRGKFRGSSYSPGTEGRTLGPRAQAMR